MNPSAGKTDVPGYGSRYDGVIDLDALRRTHQPYIKVAEPREWDGNMAAAAAVLQFWRAPIYAGFPITPSTKWLETICTEIARGKFEIERNGKKISTKQVKLPEAEHAVADYLVGAAASCRDLIFTTATSSVGLDHMAETVRSLGASGLGNVMLINVYRATANFPLCIEGDPSDTFAHRDSGFIQICCRGGQQIYDTMIQMPAIGMHPDIMTPTMPGFYGIKDSHRSTKVQAESDLQVNAFHDEMIPRCPYPSLIDGDTAMGSLVTSEYFAGFKYNQKERMRKVFGQMKIVSKAFEKHFGRPGIAPLETFGFEDQPEIAIVAMGPDAGTCMDHLVRFRRELGVKIGLVIVRLLTPFPDEELSSTLSGIQAVGVVNNAHHFGRGHLTLDVAEAMQRKGNMAPIESFFAGLGGANMSVETWETIVRSTLEAASAGKVLQPYHLLHEGRELGPAAV